MHPLLAQALGSIVRAAFMVGAGWLVRADIWTGTQADVYATALALVVPSLLWSFWKNYAGRLKLLTALAVPRATTEAVIDSMVLNGMAPSTATAKGDVPTLTHTP